MGLLGSMWNLVRTVGHVLTGNLDAVAVMWGSNPAAIRATGAAGIKKKQKRLKAIADALGPQNIQIQRIESKIKKKSSRLEELPGLIAGARTKAQQVATAKNLTKEQAATDPEVNRWLTAMNDYFKEQEGLTKDIGKYQEQIETIKARRQTLIAQGASLKKEIEEAGSRVEDTVAAVVAAKEEAAANRMMAGLTVGDNGQREMDALDKIREQAEGEAAAARDLASMELSSIEAELKATGASANNAALLDLLDLPSEQVLGTPVAVEKLPEQ